MTVVSTVRGVSPLTRLHRSCFVVCRRRSWLCVRLCGDVVAGGWTWLVVAGGARNGVDGVPS